MQTIIATKVQYNTDDNFVTVQASVAPGDIQMMSTLWECSANVIVVQIDSTTGIGCCYSLEVSCVLLQECCISDCWFTEFIVDQIVDGILDAFYVVVWLK